MEISKEVGMIVKTFETARRKSCCPPTFLLPDSGHNFSNQTFPQRDIFLYDVCISFNTSAHTQ
jgi:hypothetical protein